MVGAAEVIVSHEWYTQVETTNNADVKIFQFLVANVVECSRSRDEMYNGKNTHVQEDIAFPSMMENGTCTPPDDAPVFINTAASHHIVPAESHC